MCIRDLNLEFTKLESTHDIDAAKTLAATLHKDWRKRESASFVITTRQTEKEEEAFQKYFKQGELRESDYQANLMKMDKI